MIWRKPAALFKKNKTKPKTKKMKTLTSAETSYILRFNKKITEDLLTLKMLNPRPANAKQREKLINRMKIHTIWMCHFLKLTEK